MIKTVISHVVVIVCMLLYAASDSPTSWGWLASAVAWSFAAYWWGQAHASAKQLEKMRNR